MMPSEESTHLARFVWANAADPLLGYAALLDENKKLRAKLAELSQPQPSGDGTGQDDAVRMWNRPETAWVRETLRCRIDIDEWRKLKAVLDAGDALAARVEELGREIERIKLELAKAQIRMAEARAHLSSGEPL